MADFDPAAAPKAVATLDMRAITVGFIRGNDIREGKYYTAVTFNYRLGNLALQEGAGNLPSFIIQVAGLSLFAADPTTPADIIVDAATCW